MANEAQINLQACLSALEKLQNGPEDKVFSKTYKDHLNLLQSLNRVFSNKVEVSPEDADRVLRICLRYTKDVRCAPYVISIISELIDIDKDNLLVDFLPFSLAILEFLNTKCLEDNTSKLRSLSLQVLMKHPKSTLTKLARDHSPKIIQTFQGILGLNNEAGDLHSKIEAFKLLKILEWLSPHEKLLFLEAGISLWVAGVIPAMMQIMLSAKDYNEVEACLTYTEMLTNELLLLPLNYYENPHWKSLLLCVANPKMFPANIMDLFKNGKDNWHRIWILLMKLIKYQVTRNCSPYPSPINSMLPVVELAFKNECAQRIRAFACWNELIDIFSQETGNSPEKIIKLLMIPLKSYNTKTEETVVVKFKTWWHLMHKYTPITQNSTNNIIINFLQFMFGNLNENSVIQPIQFSHYLRKMCIEAFEDIMQVDCSVCTITNLKRLDGNIITTVLLRQHWKYFLYALERCILAVAQSYTQDNKIHIQCIWTSFLMRLETMDENTLRQDMFNDLLKTVTELILQNKNPGHDCLMEILVDDIILPLWRDDKLKSLTKSWTQHHPMHKIIKLIMDDQYNTYFKRLNSEELTRLLQPLVSYLLEESISTPEFIIGLLDELLVTKSSLVMWTALAQASKESKLSLKAFYKILMWPFKTVLSFEVKGAAEAWYTLYDIIHENLKETDFDKEISKVLTRPVEDSEASNYFVLFALIGVLNHKPDEAKMAKLEALTYEMNDYSDFEQLLTPLVNSIVLMINNTSDENLAQITINCVENILKGIQSKTTAISGKNTVQNRSMLSDTITSTLKSYLKTCPYQSIKNQVISLLSKNDKTENPKKVRSKKEANIVATVVEDGEVYAVIKSNWKFNPMNLTENQKEKLQRKRADIPALYGDQSQSQDEFKLTSWKTDSQDTSLSSSKSATSNDVSDTLKKITNSNIVPKIMLNIEKYSQSKTDANVSPIAKVKSPKADKLSTPGDTKSPRMALKDRVYRNVRNLIGNSSPSSQDKVTDKQEDTNIIQNLPKSPLPQPEFVCEENPANNAESNKKKLIPNDLITLDKQENRSPVTSAPMKTINVSTHRIDQMMKLVCTPVSNTQKNISMQVSPSQTYAERPIRLKKTPKKFSNSLLLPIKGKQCSKNLRINKLNSQDLLDSHAETVIAHIHNTNDKMEANDASPLQKVSSDEADTNENAKKSPTTTDDVIIVENVTSCAASDVKSNKDTEEASLIATKTSINKPTAKSSEKNSIGEVPSNLGVYNDAAQNESYDVKDKPYVKKSKQKMLQKTSVPKVGAQHDVITDLMDTPNISQKKFRKSKVQKEISTNDENAAVNTPVTAYKDLDQTTLSAKKTVLLNDTDKNIEEVELASTPINETKKVSDISLLLIKPEERQNTPKKVGARYNVITDLMDTPNISPKKLRNSIVQKEISAEEENAAVNTPVTSDKDLQQSKLTLEKRVLKNDTENVENIKVVPLCTNKTKRGKKSLENGKLTNIETKEASQDKRTRKKTIDVETENNKDEVNLLITKQKKKSRIEKQLGIDMVGHTFPETLSEKRLTRKNLIEMDNSKRKRLVDKLNKSELELTPKPSKKYKKRLPLVNSTITVGDSQDKAQNVLPQNIMDPCSEDVIESSQDSTMTTISVKGKIRTPKQLSVTLVKLQTIPSTTLTQNILQNCEILDKTDIENHESTDIELPQNKSVESDKNITYLTENMDTEPIGESKNTSNLTENMDTEPLSANETDYLIIRSEILPTPMTVNSESETVIGPETQELAEADTQPNDPKQFENWEINKTLLPSPNSNPPECLTIEDNDITQSLPETNIFLANMGDKTEVSSPLKDDKQRKQDFLNNTVEISPIKVQSPDRQKKSPSPETSRDFVVIQLSSPVHSNGEPFDKQCSPEFFTEDTVSPDKQNASPPRVEVTIPNSSPSASLSLKKNRPCSGRAAQMLNLLSATSDRRQKNKSSPQALRVLFGVNHTLNEEKVGTAKNFLKLQRSLPTGTSTPSGPILKRKLVEITDDSTASPASKRKRVSFHDPPVSTSISVQKYIDPATVIHPPKTSTKRQVRLGIKSPKKLDNAFLDSALCKTVESFTEATTPSDETENTSLDVTPMVEIVKTSELNDTDPICPGLIDCTDPLDVIAIELSSAAMRDSFVKELEGKVDTVGDLAKMTELEVNRLCIKAPKITVAKKVLTDYIINRPAIAVETVIEEAFSEPMTESLLNESKVDMEMQTDEVEVSSKSTQVAVEQVTSTETQTDVVACANTSVQTIESGCKTTEEIIDSCMSNQDFFNKFKEKLNEDQVQSIAGLLSEKNMLELLMKNMDKSSTTLMHRILNQHSKGIPKSDKPNAELTFLRELLTDKYEKADLGLFCASIMQTIFHKPA